jgi:hypothetical protein
MKKFFARLVVFLSLLLTSLVAVPFSAVGPSNLNVAPLSFLIQGNNELWIKGGIGALMFLFGVIFLIVSMVEHSREGRVSPSSAAAAFLPMFLYGIFGLGFAGGLAAFTYRDHNTLTNLAILGGIAVVLVNLIFLVHLLLANFRRGGNFSRILLFLLGLEIMGAGGGAGYYLYTNFVNYGGRYTVYYLGIVPAALLFFILHAIILPIRAKKSAENAQLEAEVQNLESQEKPILREPVIAKAVEPVSQTEKPEKMSKTQKKEWQKEQALAAKGKKSTIVSKEQTILSSEQEVDPTNLLFEEVNIDPEFNKTSNLDKQVSSIEYYIEKPKMFKPLDPTFDMLVAHVRGLPNVVTKISDERITFYVDRKPFLVLMNFGNYYRMAFRSDLEKGVRLIIKYPTISKNKGTKDALWFKANNYGDLPKEVVYEIVKTAFDNVNA